jgi:hypothetical protein
VAAVGLTLVVGETADAEVPVPSVTMPLRVTPPGVAAVCANAGKAAAIEISVAQRIAPIISWTRHNQHRARPVNPFGGAVSRKPKRRPRSRWPTTIRVTATE